MQPEPEKKLLGYNVPKSNSPVWKNRTHVRGTFDGSAAEKKMEYKETNDEVEGKGES